MYAAAYPGRVQNTNEKDPTAKAKVNVVCDAILAALCEVSKEKYV